MRKSVITPAVLLSVFAIACSDTATAPTPLRAPDGAAASKTPAPRARQFTLVPGTFNPDNLPGIIAEWQKFQGEKDLKGNKYYALYLAKLQPTPANAAAGADILGVAGMSPAELLTLAWDHRVGTHCGAGAPRWDIFLHDNATNKDYVTFLGCAAAPKSTGIPGTSPFPRPGSTWIRDSYSAPDIQAAVAAAALAAGASPATSVVTFLEIIFDEGPDFVYLDNIQVNQTVWTSPKDNAIKGKDKDKTKDNDDEDDDDDGDHDHGKGHDKDKHDKE
jgi:hypothetical protein